MAECWQTKAEASALSSHPFPSFLAPRRSHPADTTIDASVGVWIWRDLSCCVQWDEDGDVGIYSSLEEDGWKNRGTSPLLGLFPAVAPGALQRALVLVLTHLGTGHAELATDACCKQGFACSLLQRQSPSAGVSPGLLAPVLNGAGALGCGARSCVDSAEEGFLGSFHT